MAPAARATSGADEYDLAVEESEQEISPTGPGALNFSEHEEVVLWFEHDLFCQIHLAYLLNWFSQRPRGQTKLSLICIGGIPGIEDFRGLGQLTPEQMTSLFGERHEVTPEELELGARAWAAYSSADPREIVTLLTHDTSAMPFLRAVLQKHLARFPSRRNGLGQIENRALELIAGGAAKFGSLFNEFGKAEPIYGLGDAQFMLHLRQLASGPQPLLTISIDDAAKESSEFLGTSFTLTDNGKSVLRGEVDQIALNGIDTWLGGVHLTGNDAAWRWDEQAGPLAKAGQRVGECRFALPYALRSLLFALCRALRALTLMDIEKVRAYCLSFPNVTEDVQWENDLLFRSARRCLRSVAGDIRSRAFVKVYPGKVCRINRKRRNHSGPLRRPLSLGGAGKF